MEILASGSGQDFGAFAPKSSSLAAVFSCTQVAIKEWVACEALSLGSGQSAGSLAALFFEAPFDGLVFLVSRVFAFHGDPSYPSVLNGLAHGIGAPSPQGFVIGPATASLKGQG